MARRSMGDPGDEMVHSFLIRNVGGVDHSSIQPPSVHIIILMNSNNVKTCHGVQYEPLSRIESIIKHLVVH